MRYDVIYDGRNFSDFGIRAVCENPQATAEQNIETTHITGMNGDLHFYYGDYQNIDLTYKCALSRDYEARFRDFKNWIYNKKGYRKLWDGKFQNEYRMAAVLSAPSILDGSRAFELTFSCKPQIFLMSGSSAKKIDESGTIYNPTSFEALPLVRVYGTGALSIGEETITISENDDYIDIDCELQDAYCGTENKNENIELSSGDFFHLNSGSNGVVLENGMTIEITPRWYRI